MAVSNFLVRNLTGSGIRMRNRKLAKIPEIVVHFLKCLVIQKIAHPGLKCEVKVYK